MRTNNINFVNYFLKTFVSVLHLWVSMLNHLNKVVAELNVAFECSVVAKKDMLEACAAKCGGMAKDDSSAVNSCVECLKSIVPQNANQRD